MEHTQEGRHGGMAMRMSYRRFAVMILVSGIVMYSLMYLNTFEAAHVRYSQTRLWMAVIMAAAMALVMLPFMWSMYRKPRLNIAILAGAAVAFAVALWLVRSQRTVDDVSYMKAMIPHHSIAVLTSSRARIKDERVRRLADGIIEAQMREIGEMEALIDELERAPPASGSPVLEARDPHGGGG